MGGEGKQKKINAFDLKSLPCDLKAYGGGLFILLWLKQVKIIMSVYVIGQFYTVEKNKCHTPLISGRAEWHLAFGQKHSCQNNLASRSEARMTSIALKIVRNQDDEMMRSQWLQVSYEWFTIPKLSVFLFVALSTTFLLHFCLVAFETEED